jgi:predicted Zn-dependent protease
MKITALFVAVLFAVFPFGAPCNAQGEIGEAPPPGATPQEIEMGKKAIEQIEKDPEYKPLDLSKPENKALSEKLNAMAKKLGAVSSRPGINYHVTILNDEDLNAFTLPNGQIYFYKGLIDVAGSDDELAAVMAHEIGHNARMHVLRLQKKSKPLNWAAIAAMVAMMTGKAGADIARITPYVLTGIASGYQVEYEKEADAAAIPELIACGYNPSALVTFMNRMAAEEQRRPKIEMGIYQTHPPSPERAAAARAEIERRGLVFSPRAVEGSAQAEVLVKDKVATVKWKTVEVLSLHGDDAKPRADAIAKRLNDLLRGGLKLPEVQAAADDKGGFLQARGIEIARADNAEAKAQGLAPLALAQQWRANLSRVFWQEARSGAL